MKKGLLLINLGTPDTTKFWDVWKYLSQFLADQRVLVMPFWLRYLLLYGWILPTRVLKTQRAYQLIWTKNGSPLRLYSEQFCKKLQKKLLNTHQVALAMRYGSPTIEQALSSLQACTDLTILPLYPQYAAATTGSSIEAVLQRLGQRTVIPALKIMTKFYDHPAFVHAQSRVIAPYLQSHQHLIFSYHGLPEQHLLAMGCHTICTGACSQNALPICYRAQCFHTTALLAQALNLKKTNYSTVFQSRLGATPWIKPYMESELQALAGRHITRIAVVCPSFVTDCLETLEEIGIRMTAYWKSLGGECLTLIPCLNADDAWCEAFTNLTSE